jgi:hypothetical protein
MKDKLIEKYKELVDWLDSECPTCLPPLEPFTTFDLSHNFAENLRDRLDELFQFELEIEKEQSQRLSAREFILKREKSLIDAIGIQEFEDNKVYFIDEVVQFMHEFANQGREARKFFYCQRQIEGESMCIEQCDHCREYYKPLESK